MEVYDKQIKPLKNPFLIAFVIINAIIGTIIFIPVIRRISIYRLVYLYENKSLGVLVGICYPIPGAYLIKLFRTVHHKNRRLKELEEEKTEAVSCGLYDANS